MEKYEIENLRDLPIEEVASQLGLQVARHKSLCPFHSDHHASLSFNTRKNLCRCFVCMDESLDSIGLVMNRYTWISLRRASGSLKGMAFSWKKAGEGFGGGIAGLLRLILLIRLYLLHLLLLKHLLHLP